MASLIARETSQRRRYPYVGHSLTGAVDSWRWWWRSPGYGGCLVNVWRERIYQKILIKMIVLKCLRASVLILCPLHTCRGFLLLKFDNLLLLWQKNIFLILYCTKIQTSLVQYGVKLVVGSVFYSVSILSPCTGSPVFIAAKWVQSRALSSIGWFALSSKVVLGFDTYLDPRNLLITVKTPCHRVVLVTFSVWLFSTWKAAQGWLD